MTHPGQIGAKMEQIRAGYLCAGYDTYSSIVDQFINGKYNRYNDHFTREQASYINSHTISGFLHSFGQNFVGRKKFGTYVEKEAEIFRHTRQTRLFDNCNFYVDSGGFQAGIGKINPEETDILIELYHQFLVEHQDLYEHAFVLDLPPGPICKLYQNWDDVFKMNMRTYQMAADLPEDVRDKMIYIHHFRTPRQWGLFNRILREGNFFDKFKYHATGGIVANLSSDMKTPCVLYCLPLVPLLNECLKASRNYLKFHILGGANFRDILFYELFKLHVSELHGVEIEFTYDSSGLFKALMVGRNIHVTTGTRIQKLNLRTKFLKNRFYEHWRSEEYFFLLMDELADKYGLKRLGCESIYCDKLGTFHNETRVYAMMYMLDFYSVMQTRCREYAAQCYEFFKGGDLQTFNSMVTDMILKFNGGKITRKQLTKASAICNSLKILEDLDEEYCQFIIRTYLSKDEFSNLSKGGTGILQF